MLPFSFRLYSSTIELSMEMDKEGVVYVFILRNGARRVVLVCRRRDFLEAALNRVTRRNQRSDKERHRIPPAIDSTNTRHDVTLCFVEPINMMKSGAIFPRPTCYCCRADSVCASSFEKDDDATSGSH